MTLEQAYKKLKKEFKDLERAYNKLKKENEGLKKDDLSNPIIQEKLKEIRGLKKELKEEKEISHRYQVLYKKKCEEFDKVNDKCYDLQRENYILQQQLDIANDDEYKEFMEKLNTPDDKEIIAALKEEVARLKSQLDADGTNVGLPTAQTPINKNKVIPNSRVKSGKKKGGQPGHEKHEMEQFSDEEITDTVYHEVLECPECGSHNLDNYDCKVKDEYDYEVRIIKRRHVFYEYTCKDCGATFRAPYNGLVASNQYGPVIQATALSLMNVGFVSMNRTQKILKGFSGEPMTLSEGYLAKLQKRYAKKLASFMSQMKTYVTSLPILFWDDTVVFVNTARACMRFYGDDRVAYYTAHEHKDLAGIMEDDILPKLTGDSIVMHDHNTINYNNGFIFKNVECLQHLERDLQKLVDSSNHKWPADLKELIKSNIHKRKQLIAQGYNAFSPEEIAEILKKLDKILADGYKEYIADLGHYYEKDENALLNRFRVYKENYFAWIKDFEIPTTNNISERSLRSTKTKSKVSGQFQSIEYASYFATIRTYIETCNRNGINEYQALLRLTTGNPYSLSDILSYKENQAVVIQANSTSGGTSIQAIISPIIPRLSDRIVN